MNPHADPTRGWRLGTPGGVPLYLARSWPILLGVILLWYGPQVGRALPALSTPAAYGVAGAYALLLLVSVLAHEAAHAVAARATGATVGRVVIDLFGGHTVYETTRATPGRTAAVAVVGPLANGVLAALGWALLPVLPDGVPWLLGAAFVVTNGVVGVFNLVPGHPLDGGHLLEAVVWRVTGRRHVGMIVSGWAGLLVVIALVGWLVVRPLASGRPPSFVMLAWTGLIGAMLWSSASQAIREGERIRAYERVDVADLLVPVIVVDGRTPMETVVDASSRSVWETGRTPVVLVRIGCPTDEVMGLLVTPGADIPTGSTAEEFTARLGEGWVVDAPTLPPLAAIVDHMHASWLPVVVLRAPGGALRAVTAGAARAALGRAGGTG